MTNTPDREAVALDLDALEKVALEARASRINDRVATSQFLIEFRPEVVLALIAAARTPDPLVKELVDGVARAILISDVAQVMRAESAYTIQKHSRLPTMEELASVALARIEGGGL